jgi:hypothetical protein
LELQLDVEVNRQIATAIPLVPAAATGVKQVVWLPPVATHWSAAKTALLQAHSEAQATSCAMHALSKHPHRAPAVIVAALAFIGVQAAPASAPPAPPGLPVPPLPPAAPPPAPPPEPPLEPDPHPPGVIAANGMVTSEIARSQVAARIGCPPGLIEWN